MCGGTILKKATRTRFPFPERLARVGLGAVALLSFSAMLFLFLSSMLATSDMSTENFMKELVVFKTDSLPRNLLLLALTITLGVTVILLLRGWGKWEKVKPWHLALGIGIWITVVGSLWVAMSLSAPTHDSRIVTAAGYAAAQGDLSQIDADYFLQFPFQLGYVFWTELWARVFSLTNTDFIFMEFVNVLCLAFGEAALVLLTERLFKSREVTVATALMLAVFPQPVIFSTFLYGTIPGLCFAAWSIYFLVRYMQTDRYRYLLPAALCLSVAVALKLNNLILLVAAAIILAAHLLKRPSLRRLLAVFVLCATVMTLPNFGKWQYSLRLHKDFGDGIPMVSWLAMGLHDAEPGPGWYDGTYTVTNFWSHSGDGEAASEASMEVVQARLEQMAEEPRETAAFFRDKILSQWNETTYQSIWNNQVRGQFGEKWGVAKLVCGDGEAFAKSVMDAAAQLVYGGMLLATVFLLLDAVRKKQGRPEDEAARYLIPLLFLGGFLYHALFEAKSQYVITYVVCMIPYAAWGFARVCGAGKRIWGRCKDRKNVKQ